MTMKQVAMFLWRNLLGAGARKMLDTRIQMVYTTQSNVALFFLSKLGRHNACMVIEMQRTLKVWRKPSEKFFSSQR